jgi:hypothetical protein
MAPIWMNRSVVVEHWINDRPSSLDGILTRKKRTVPGERCSQQPFIGRLLVGLLVG